MASAPLFLRVYGPSMILTLMSLASLLLPAVDYSTRISIPGTGTAVATLTSCNRGTAHPSRLPLSLVSTILIFVFMYEETKELGGHTRYWLMVNLLFSLAVVIEFVFVGPKYKYKSINGDGEKVNSHQLEQIRLSVSRSQLDRRSLLLLTVVYFIFLLAWFLS